LFRFWHFLVSVLVLLSGKHLDVPSHLPVLPSIDLAVVTAYCVVIRRLDSGENETMRPCQWNSENVRASEDLIRYEFTLICSSV